MAKKYNKYGAGHKNTNKINLDDINPSYRASKNGMGHQECYDKGYTYLSGKIDKQGMTLWVDPQEINKSVKKWDNIDKDILKMLFFGRITQGKALVDVDFYILAIAISGRLLDTKNSVCIDVDTKEMSLTYSMMEQTLENVYEYEAFIKENGKATKV